MPSSIDLHNTNATNNIHKHKKEMSKESLMYHNIFFAIVLLCTPIMIKVALLLLSKYHQISTMNTAYDCMLLTIIPVIIFFIALPHYDTTWWFPTGEQINQRVCNNNKKRVRIIVEAREPNHNLRRKN